MLAEPAAAMCAEAKPLTSTPEGILGQYALDSRLSYLLWSGAPDDAAYAGAAAGQLRLPSSLAAQVDRMLAPAAVAAHASAFPADFPNQFLPLSALATVQPSPALFPAFDPALRQAMADESRLFFADLLSNNGSALDLL